MNKKIEKGTSNKKKRLWWSLLLVFFLILSAGGLTFLLMNKDKPTPIEPPKQTYTITWLNDDESPLGTTTVEEQELPAQATPRKPETVQSQYTFAGWQPEVVPAVADATYTAFYKETPQTYTIKWLDYSGKSVKTDTDITYGADIQALVPFKMPDVPCQDGSHHEFKEWIDLATWTWEGLTAIPKDHIISFYADYDKYYRVFWEVDGQETVSEEVKQGEMPQKEPNNPTKEADAQYTYEFTGWDQPVGPVTKNVTYKAVFAPTAQLYTVKWVGHGSDHEENTGVKYGADLADLAPKTMPEYQGADGSKNRFQSWPALADWQWTPEMPIPTDHTIAFTAAYDAFFVVTWQVEGQETIEEVKKGEKAQKEPENPTKAGNAQYKFTFTGWSGNVNQPIMGNTTYKAQFKQEEQKYTVNWLDYNGAVEKTQTNIKFKDNLKDLAPAEMSDIINEGRHQFNGMWDGLDEWQWQIDKIPAKNTIEFKAKYDNYYTITWVNEDGSPLMGDNNYAYVTEVKEGEVPEYKGPVPEKVSDYNWTYDFDPNNSWTNAATNEDGLKPATSNTTYKANFIQKKQNLRYSFNSKLKAYEVLYFRTGEDIDHEKVVISSKYDDAADRNSSNHGIKPVVRIGTYAFSVGEVNIKELLIPDSITTIASYSFGSGQPPIQKGLDKIYLSIESSQLKTIEPFAFAHNALKHFIFPNSLETIGSSAFMKTSLSEAIFTENSKLTTVGVNAFSNNENLAKVELPDSLNVILKDSLSNTGITELYIPNSVKAVGPSIVNDCQYLQQIRCGAPYPGAGRQPDGWDKDWNISNVKVLWNQSR